MIHFTLLAGLCLGLYPPDQSSEKPFVIEVVDDQTGRGVPLVELRTVHNVSYWTDSNGLVTFHEPGLMNREVFFFVESHGYEFPKDGFSFRGQKLKTIPGGTVKLTIHRKNIAERLYRITGAGIYRDTILAGRTAPRKKPVLNGEVFGSDSAHTSIYQGKLFWIWGDTNRASYPLGNFQVTAATTDLSPAGRLNPENNFDLNYFTRADGFAKEMCKMPGEGLTWIDALVTLKDKTGKERLLASYVKVKAPMNVHALGLAEFNESKQLFEHRKSLPLETPIRLSGHVIRHKDNDLDYLYFADPFPILRVRATVEDFLNPDSYEAFTCLVEKTNAKERKVARSSDGKLQYAWKRGTPSVPLEIQEALITSKTITREEGRWRLEDAVSERLVRPHRGSVQWNEFRKCWIMITCEVGGSSNLGEIWYAESKSLEGPWSGAVKVATHNKYSFYNPFLHPEFDGENGRYVYFEGTYTTSFSGNTNPTPRYEYNQILYKLDLADPRLKFARN